MVIENFFLKERKKERKCDLRADWKDVLWSINIKRVKGKDNRERHVISSI